MEDSLVIIESQVIVLQMCVKGYLCSYENVDFWQKKKNYMFHKISLVRYKKDCSLFRILYTFVI